MDVSPVSGRPGNGVAHKPFFRKSMQRFLTRRLPAAKQVVLDQRSVFVLPTKAGLAFCMTALLVWFLGTNYQNNLALASCYLLISIFIVTILYTFNNLSGVRLSFLNAKTAFMGEEVEIEMLVSRKDNSTRENIVLQWPGSDIETADLLEGSEKKIVLFVQADKRGWFNPGRVLVETRYPLGLIRCWTWVDLDVKALIYPKPIPAGLPPDAKGTQRDGDEEVSAGAEDFYGLRPYQEGEPLNHVSWKHYAKGLGLQIKEFSDYQSQDCWLDWDMLAGEPKETRLSKLCYWALEISKTHIDYGLRLPGVEVPLGQGVEHKHTVLKALALFDTGRDTQEAS